ncbi:unnamed protein product [Paramecium octaurelia]|uniref:Uncharacterized protein n=1 Tax=Paramecium octaurelia TaxID=43137 RepID=A0A8S1T7E1_PAROT|nr:unnamed protein product [Paramecium octaurelia]
MKLFHGQRTIGYGDDRFQEDLSLYYGQYGYPSSCAQNTIRQPSSPFKKRRKIYYSGSNIGLVNLYQQCKRKKKTHNRLEQKQQDPQLKQSKYRETLEQ